MEAYDMSMFSRCDKLMNNDPFEEIFALNLGDFLSEHLISDELASKIKKKIKSEPQNLKEQLQELISIYSINNTLNLLGFNNNGDYVVYNTIAKTLVKMVDAGACHIFLAKERMRGNIEKDLFLAGSSVDFCHSDYSYDVGYMKDEDNAIVKVYNCAKEIVEKSVTENINYELPSCLKSQKADSFAIFPMSNQQICVGVILIEKFDGTEFIEEYQKLIAATGRLFATSLQLQTLTEEAMVLINKERPKVSLLKHLRAQLTVTIGDLGDEQQIFVEKLASAVDAKGAYNGAHSRRVATLAKKLCEELKLNEKTKDLIYYAALLQNIGKIILPREIFDKKEKLSEQEIELLKTSPNVGVNILMQINFLSEVIPYIHYHKERWDGKGLPEGLKGQSIPFGSRIVAVADAYCALRTERSFREKFNDEKALCIIKSESGIKWDPDVVFALEQVDRN